MLSRNRILCVLIVASLALAYGNAQGQEEPKRVEVVKSELSPSPLQPGKVSTATVEVEVKEGFHAQSHTPNETYAHKFMIILEKNPALKFGDVEYPKGKDADFKALGILNVYTGKVSVQFPVELTPGTSPADAVIRGKVDVQVCDDNVCYAPVKLPFQIGGGAAATAPTTARAAGTDLGPVGSPPIILTGLYSSGALHNAIVAAIEGKSVAASDEAPQYTVPVAFFFAFLAGLVFNVMPCVLPVLPLKAMGFYEASQHNRLRCIGYGLAFSLGVVSSFLVLGLLVVVKQVFKWGEIFSNPWFLGALVIILLLMAFFTFGFFQIRLPNAMYSVSPRHDTFFGNILFGILTAALSTPCTFGMFVGLLTFALKQPPAVGLALMGTVGAGMASPYLVLERVSRSSPAFPAHRALGRACEASHGVPAPGHGRLFRRAVHRATASAAGLLVDAFRSRRGGGYISCRTIHADFQDAGRAGRFGFHRDGADCAGSSVDPPADRASLQLGALQQTGIARRPSKNQVVLVEFTADWCTTCHSLEALVLNDPGVVVDVNKYGVKMIRADLTDTDAPGWMLLRKYATGQGVPLTAVYPKQG